MKLAAIADIHGNLPALEAVLEDIKHRGIDQVLNLGDIFSGCLYPRETADKLMPMSLPTIRGNHERNLLSSDLSRLGPSDFYTVKRLTPNQLDWIATLPASLHLFDEVLLVHGTPASDVEYLLETVTQQGLRPATDKEVEERVNGCEASLILCGHTHLPRIVLLSDGRLVVNPGSVGLQAYADQLPWPHIIEAGTPHARYAILEKRQKCWSAEILSVAYDWSSAARQADINGRPDWSQALRTGRI